MIGQVLGHYRIDSRLGEGGMGVVYKAHDTHLARPVANKLLPPAKVADAGRKQRFVQEARATSALNHPQMIMVHLGKYRSLRHWLLEGFSQPSPWRFP